MNHKKIRRKNNFSILKMKNCKETSSLHRSKYAAYIETPLVTVFNGYM